ncbi:alpha/beta fold hydrolase [Rhodococcus chondri]|uniref:Alpha/beta hydrolase n=1 Tax=Rhodococcus chondri TaxID=3065941 RepID=A0ABU7JQW1_9NOCA|nr:alpha/beta hydrolase [Rhodococcus sp. CC-R104]MEE2032418.1 alpha/beta hydrolase [Rhodococcus sp. CC-R104]
MLHQPGCSRSQPLPACTAVVLPGTGSDAQFVDRAFRGPLHRHGIDTIAVEPDPRRIVASYLDAMDTAAADGPILVGGVSIGAAVALDWARRRPGRTVGVLAALPAWTGNPDDAPAAAMARWTAGQLRAHGLEAVTAAMRESSPVWLGAALTRSWRAHWPDLPEALEEAANYHAPDVDGLRTIGVPVGITAAVDDAVHPLSVGRQWAAALPCAALETIELADIGADPSVLGDRCLVALDEARSVSADARR